MKAFLSLLLTISLIVTSKADDEISTKKLSKFSRYSVGGILSLPYAEISEPFMAWYDEDQWASRIDYYDGMVNTVQLAPKNPSSYGSGIKVVPMTDEVQTNVKTCFWLNGTEEAPVEIQSVLPDTTGFTFIGSSSWKGHLVDRYQSIDQQGDKKNTYTYYVSSKTGLPVFYEMIGYDSLLGSHYDRYYIEYFTFSTAPIPSSIFSISTDLKCRLFPGPGAFNRVSINPMREFIHSDDSNTESQFEDFKNKHNKEYNTHVEHEERQHIFRTNLRYIESMNRKGLSFKLAVNHLADKSDEELRILRGKQKPTSKQNNGLPFDKSEFPKETPADWDWRLYGAVAPVKDQGVCGSCWSFGTTGAIEGAYFVKHKKLIRLSSQNLVDCSWGFGNNGCDGGEDFRAYDWIIKHGGIATEESYPYLQNDAFCHFKNATIGTKMTGYVNVTVNDAEALKIALINKGPISIAIDAG
jgi:hypothetical protein